MECIGDAVLYLGDCREIVPTLPRVDSLITDPPYSLRSHAGHNLISRGDTYDAAEREKLNYAGLTEADVFELAAMFARACAGWIVWMTDHYLSPVVTRDLQALGRYVFAPLPFYQPGRSVRLCGDGPSCWTDWIVCSRTAAQNLWGTLPGGYVAGPGWNDRARIGGKPTALMDALVSDYSRPGATVLDTHMGAGTTGVACVRMGRKFVGVEVDAQAFDVACERIACAWAQRPLFTPQPLPVQCALWTEGAPC